MPIKALIVWQDEGNIEGAVIDTMAHFLEVNDELEEVWHERLEAMKVGERIVYNGGSSGTFWIERIGDLDNFPSWKTISAND